MNEASHSLDRLAAATDRVLATAVTLSDAQVREPSPLPGWTRGHVLTHMARNADGLGNLLRWARTGNQTPMYASPGARSADIDAGAGRPAADQAADVREASAAFAAEAARMTADDWTAQVRALYGDPFPAINVLDRRMTEVEIHHVDLAAGYTPDDWPADFVAGILPAVAGSFADREDAPRCLVWAEGTPQAYRIGPEGDGPPRVVIHGRAADLLAWLTGRADGSRLTVASGGTLPEMPGW
jgi:maleylpyruvate isomerase